MKQYLVSRALAVVLVAGVFVAVAATSDGAEPSPDGISGPVAVAGDEPADVLPSDGPLVPDADPPADPGSDPVSRPGWFIDLLDGVELTSEGLAERVVDLSQDRVAGVDPADAVASLIDEVAVFGEGLITGVAVTPDTLADVPDLRKVHGDLISGADALYGAAEALGSAGDDASWNAGVTDFLEAAASLAALVELAR